MFDYKAFKFSNEQLQNVDIPSAPPGTRFSIVENDLMKYIINICFSNSRSIKWVVFHKRYMHYVRALILYSSNNALSVTLFSRTALQLQERYKTMSASSK